MNGCWLEMGTGSSSWLVFWANGCSALLCPASSSGPHSEVEPQLLCPASSAYCASELGIHQRRQGWEGPNSYLAEKRTSTNHLFGRSCPSLVLTKELEYLLKEEKAQSLETILLRSQQQTESGEVTFFFKLHLQKSPNLTGGFWGLCI